MPNRLRGEQVVGAGGYRRSSDNRAASRGGASERHDGALGSLDRRREIDVLGSRRCDHHVPRRAYHDVSMVRIASRRRPERRSYHDPHAPGIVGVGHALQDVTVQDDDGSVLQLLCGDRTPEGETVRLLMVGHGLRIRRRARLA